MVMVWLRSCYAFKFRLWVDGVERVANARYYFCLPGAKLFPHYHGGEASPWLDNYEVNRSWGEVTPYPKDPLSHTWKKLNRGVNPGYPGQCYTGELEWFITGRLPPLPVPPPGPSSCCFGSQWTSSGSLVMSGTGAGIVKQSASSAGSLVLEGAGVGSAVITAPYAVTVMTAGTYQIPVAADATSLVAEAWAAGGGGGNSNIANGAGGGGGGGFAGRPVAVPAPGLWIVEVGAGGAGGTGTGSGGAGSPSVVTDPLGTIQASVSGGGGGIDDTGGGAGGAGGALVAGSYGYIGGAGGLGDYAGIGFYPGAGGGGGGGAGSGGDGSPGNPGYPSPPYGGAGGPPDGGAGGYGDGVQGGTAIPGFPPGGGGGGDGANQNNGEPGADGQVVLSWLRQVTTACAQCPGGSSDATFVYWSLNASGFGGGLAAANGLWTLAWLGSCNWGYNAGSVGIGFDYVGGNWQLSILVGSAHVTYSLQGVYNCLGANTWINPVGSGGTYPATLVTN